MSYRPPHLSNTKPEFIVRINSINTFQERCEVPATQLNQCLLLSLWMGQGGFSADSIKHRESLRPAFSAFLTSIEQYAESKLCRHCPVHPGCICYALRGLGRRSSRWWGILLLGSCATCAQVWKFFKIHPFVSHAI